MLSRILKCRRRSLDSLLAVIAVTKQFCISMLYFLFKNPILQTVVFTVDEEASNFFICMFKDVLSCLADFIRVMLLALYIPNVVIQ